MQKIKWCDLHCDTLTYCLDNGGDLYGAGGQVNLRKLRRAGCVLQCFAIFTDGENAAARYEQAYALYKNSLLKYGDIIRPVFCYSDFLKARREKKTASLLTVENLGFIGNNLSEIARLKDDGVRMCSLVWNNKNQFAYPNLVQTDGKPRLFERQKTGLTELGRQAVEELNRNKIIIDISHLSDGGLDDVLRLTSAPVVASHSNSYGLCGVSRNLCDGQIKKIAGKGGVIGVNYCKDFVGADNVLDGVCRHIRYLINTGGEDCVALGSDFDGIPAPYGLESCVKVPLIFENLRKEGVSPRVIEKLERENFLRVFKEVAG